MAAASMSTIEVSPGLPPSPHPPRVAAGNIDNGTTTTSTLHDRSAPGGQASKQASRGRDKGGNVTVSGHPDSGPDQRVLFPSLLSHTLDSCSSVEHGLASRGALWLGPRGHSMCMIRGLE